MVTRWRTPCLALRTTEESIRHRTSADHVGKSVEEEAQHLHWETLGQRAKPLETFGKG